MVVTETVARRLEVLHGRIERAGGDPARVTVLAVTKGFGVDAVRAALGSGLTEIGENYADELVDKARAFEVVSPAAPHWHYLGAIQRRKVPRLAPLVTCWQSVARATEGAAIAREAHGRTVLVQVDTTGMAGRNGVPPESVPALVETLGEMGLDVVGLMTLAPRDPGGARTAFRTVRALADDLGLPERSMGMTDDLELAVAEGSTMVRIGRGLFGDRPSAHGPDEGRPTSGGSGPAT
jgi:uncharacterized pyridoxal phosphate-containing UPF0001 family protein